MGRGGKKKERKDKRLESRDDWFILEQEQEIREYDVRVRRRIKANTKGWDRIRGENIYGHLNLNKLCARNKQQTFFWHIYMYFPLV